MALSVTRNAAGQMTINLSPKQTEFVTSTKPIRALRAGRGFGKSSVGAIDMMLRSKPGGLYMVVAPTYGVLQDTTMRSFKEAAELLGVWDDKGFRTQPHPSLKGKNGAEYLFRSADTPGSLRGGDKAGVWFDEMQESDEEAFRIIEPALRQWGKRGWISATFTPGSPDHWTSRIFINGQNPDVHCIQASLKDNIFISQEIYEGLLRSWAASPMRIRRELEGECVYLEGAEWLPEYFDNVGFDQWPLVTDASDEGIRVVSLDPSKGKGDKEGDYSAFVLSWFHKGTIYVDADMRNDRGDIEITQTGVKIFSEFKPHYFVIENESGQNDHLIRDMHRIADSMGLIMPITPMDSRVFSPRNTGHGQTKMDKKSRIRQLAGYISERWFRYRNHSPGSKILVEQLMAFPLSAHDDAPDALAYAVAMLQKATTGQVRTPSGYGLTEMGKIIQPNYRESA